MTSSGIGWGVTQNITNYTGATIKDIPIGCVVIVQSNSEVYDTRSPFVNFSGTFAMLDLQYKNQDRAPTLVGSKIHMVTVGIYHTTNSHGDEYSVYQWGGDIHQALLKEKEVA